MTVDSIVAVLIVAGAAYYLYRKFSKPGKESGCACSSGGSCCGQGVDSHGHGCGSRQ